MQQRPGQARRKEAPLSEETLSYNYKFFFEDGKFTEFNCVLDSITLELKSDLPEPYPEWTELEVHRCPHCPLDPRLESHCPVALNVLAPVSFFRDSLSYEKADVFIASEDRRYMKHTTIQEGLSSLVGLCMATSGCPHLDFLRPMVRFHLPFATSEETMYRAITMYLYAQHIRMKQGDRPDWELKDLDVIYENIRTLNKSFVDRLRSTQIKDATLNALVNLDCFAISVKFSLNFNMLDDVSNYFGAYMA
jgi:hypothetical protein